MIITDKFKLTKECKDVSIFEAPSIVKKLEFELLNSKIPGVGLSANQINIDFKVCILRLDKIKLDLANPVIINQYDLSLFEDEGCLSFPDEYVSTKRYGEIEIRDLFHPNGIILTGYMAVIAQHEISHLYGKTMYDFQVQLPASLNSPCWCQSGKRFKKCCEGKVIDPF